jgi:hypothetical protein
MEKESLDSNVDSTQEEEQTKEKEEQPKRIYSGTKIIRKNDVDYNIFMKLGRKIRYKAKLIMENETWKIRSKTLWKNYWKRFSCEDWIYLTLDQETEEALANLDCAFKIMEKYGDTETYFVSPKNDETAFNYYLKRKTRKILESIKSPTIDEITIKCEPIVKLDEFLKKRYDKNKDEIKEIAKKYNLKIMNCQVEIFYKQNRKKQKDQEEQNKVKEFIKEISGKFKKLNIKMKKEFQGYGISLNLIIHCRRPKAKEKHKTPLMTEYDIFPTIENQEEANYMNQKKKKKQVRLIKPTKVKTMKKMLNIFKEQNTQLKSDCQKIKDPIINYIEFLDANQQVIPANKFANYKKRATLMIEEINNK